MFAFKRARGKLEIVELMQFEWDLNVILISSCKYYKIYFSLPLISMRSCQIIVNSLTMFPLRSFIELFFPSTIPFDYYRSWIIAFIRTSSSSDDRQINFLCIFNLITVVVARHTLKSIINTWAAADRT